MGTGIDLRTFFQSTYSVNNEGVENIFDLINASIMVAARDKPKEFLARRSRIIEALLLPSPQDDNTDHDCQISSSSNTSCASPVDQDLDDQYEELIDHDRVMLASLSPINLGAKDCGIIQSEVFDEENNDKGKNLHRKIEVHEVENRKLDKRRRNKGLGSEEVKFEATKRKFEETSEGIKATKRRIQIVDFKDVPQPKLNGLKKSSFRRRC
ncbi:Uncharacterized protein Fot_31531 [Forsythia ovata]|uniref:Uncharacterized protein n=1 Tax=Forsythia ovata TaxID=205694 RepID=A0ABD1T577_9LAMI